MQSSRRRVHLFCRFPIADRGRSAAILTAVLVTVVVLGVVLVVGSSPSSAAERRDIKIRSTLDGTEQPCYVILPDGFRAGEKTKRPLLVSLHTWSGGVEQRRPALEKLASDRGWLYIFPHFRGANLHPDACGSLKAQQDILDAVDWARQHLPVDAQRIYLAGTSGGGHMTMLMAGRHPDVWAAASAWVGISDLASWHAKHADGNYGAMIRKSCGGKPGSSREVDAQYRSRSPLTFLHQATRVPLDVAAGIHDGHTGSVPIRHSLEAFNAIAKAAGEPQVSDAEMQQLSQPEGRLEKPKPSDLEKDPSFDRAIYLRRRAAKSRVTIFEGGHESLPAATIRWLEQHVREEPAPR